MIEPITPIEAAYHAARTVAFAKYDKTSHTNPDASDILDADLDAANDAYDDAIYKETR